MNHTYYSLVQSLSLPGGESPLIQDDMYLRGRFTQNGRMANEGYVQGEICFYRRPRSHCTPDVHPPILAADCIEKDCLLESDGGYLELSSLPAGLLTPIVEDGLIDPMCLANVITSDCFIPPRSYIEDGYAWFVDLYVLCKETLTRTLIERVPLNYDLTFTSTLYLSEGVKVAHVVRTPDYYPYDHVYTIYSPDYSTLLRTSLDSSDLGINYTDQETNVTGVLRSLFCLLVSGYSPESELEITRGLIEPVYPEILEISLRNLQRIQGVQVTSGENAGAVGLTVRPYTVLGSLEAGVYQVVEDDCLAPGCLQDEAYNHTPPPLQMGLESTAWWVLTGVLYELKSGDRRFRTSLQTAGRWLIEQMQDTGLYTDAAGDQSCYLNVVICLALAKLYDLTGDPVYVSVLSDLESQIASRLYNPESGVFVNKVGGILTREAQAFGYWWAIVMGQLAIQAQCTLSGSLSTMRLSGTPLALIDALLWQCKQLARDRGYSSELPGVEVTPAGSGYYGADLAALAAGERLWSIDDLLLFESREVLDVYRFQRGLIQRRLIEDTPVGYGWYSWRSLVGGHAGDLLASMARALAVNEATAQRLRLASSISTVLTAELRYWENGLVSPRQPNESLEHYRARYQAASGPVLSHIQAIEASLGSHGVASRVDERSGIDRTLRYAGPLSVAEGNVFADASRYGAGVVEVYTDIPLDSELLRTLVRRTPRGSRIYLQAEVLLGQGYCEGVSCGLKRACDPVDLTGVGYPFTET